MSIRRSTGRVRAQRVIVTVPVTRTLDIEFRPDLEKRQLTAHRDVPFGRATKLATVFQHKPSVRFDLAVGAPPFAFAWGRGDCVAAMTQPDFAAESSEVLGGQLDDVFGMASGDRLWTAAVDWNAEPFAGGTHVAFRPGQVTRHAAALRQQHGLVHFAGAERSQWPDSMEGAVESGVTVAERLLRGLRK